MPSARVIAHHDTVKGASRWFAANPFPDLVLLDVQLADGTAFDLLDLVKINCPIIFTTAYSKFALNAFKAKSIDYLLKPFSKERFNKALKKWKEQHQANDTKNNSHNTAALLENAHKQPEEQNRVVVKNGNNIKIIPVQEIHYIEAYDDYVKIFTKDGYSLKKKTMSYFEQAFNAEQCVRVHRSYIVQVQQITKIETLEKDSHIALLKTGIRIPLSKTGYAKLKMVLGL